MKRLSAERRFWRLYWFIYRFPKLRITIHRTAARARGQAHLFRRRPCRIELWLPRRPTAQDYSELTATLIHEYGHCVLRYTPHSEREAWAFGRRSIPTEVVPASWRSFKRYCLSTYPKRLRNARRIGAFGRSWRWVEGR